MNNIKELVARVLTRFHTLILNNKCNVIGAHSRVYYKSSIINKIVGGIIIGENCMIGRTNRGYHVGMPFFTTLLNDGDNSHISIGNNCRINGVYIHSKDFISIGDNCVMASGITIVDSNAHQVNSGDRTVGQDKPKGITIGNNVWVGLNSIILKGTVIGNNCVVSAGSVVKGVFPDNTIIQGNPAIIVGQVSTEVYL